MGGGVQGRLRDARRAAAERPERGREEQGRAHRQGRRTPHLRRRLLVFLSGEGRGGDEERARRGGEARVRHDARHSDCPGLFRAHHEDLLLQPHRRGLPRQGSARRGRRRRRALGSRRVPLRQEKRQSHYRQGPPRQQPLPRIRRGRQLRQTYAAGGVGVDEGAGALVCLRPPG